MAREILGHIDCPHCAEVARMRITPDKNGAPFGYCEECNGQLKVGGNQSRVAAFYRKYPQIKKPGEPSPVHPGTKEDTPPAVAPTPPAAVAKAPEAPKPKAAHRKLSIFEQLEGITQ